MAKKKKFNTLPTPASVPYSVLGDIPIPYAGNQVKQEVLPDQIKKQEVVTVDKYQDYLNAAFQKISTVASIPPGGPSTVTHTHTFSGISNIKIFQTLINKTRTAGTLGWTYENYFIYVNGNLIRNFTVTTAAVDQYQALSVFDQDIFAGSEIVVVIKFIGCTNPAGATLTSNFILNGYQLQSGT